MTGAAYGTILNHVVDYLTDLRLDRTLAAPPEWVWDALTNADALAAWFWPERFDTKAHTDPRPGGSYRIEGGGMAVHGTYVAVEAPTRLVFTWRWDGDQEETLVTITLSPPRRRVRRRVELSTVDGGTALTLTHERFADPSSRDNHLTGWSDCLDRLPGWLAARAHHR